MSNTITEYKGLDRAELWNPLVGRFNEQEAANG